ncbi:RAMP superfamily CRISPR-associated protein [Streptomyces sp. NPDC002520]
MFGDWHIGTGAGRHSMVDRSVQLDDDGLPFIPGKALAGVWRDGCESAVCALGEGERGPWHAWLEYLFGSQRGLERRGVVEEAGTGRPRPAALFVDSLHYPRSVVTALRDKPRLRQATTFLKPGPPDPVTDVRLHRLRGGASHPSRGRSDYGPGWPFPANRAMTGSTSSSPEKRCSRSAQCP